MYPDDIALYIALHSFAYPYTSLYMNGVSTDILEPVFEHEMLMSKQV